MDIKMGTRTYLKNEVEISWKKELGQVTMFAAEEPDTAGGSVPKDGRDGSRGAPPWGGQAASCN